MSRVFFFDNLPENQILITYLGKGIVVFRFIILECSSLRDLGPPPGNIIIGLFFFLT
jgi:hypothetical protein